MMFASVNPILADNITRPAEIISSGKDYVSWGSDNAYPLYLDSLYHDVATLKTIIDGSVDYICGDDINSTINLGFGVGVMNRKGDTISDIITRNAYDIEKYNAFALEIIRNYEGSVAEIYACPIPYLRTNKERNAFWYCESWDKRRSEIKCFPAWRKDTQEPHTILYVSRSREGVYPTPIYGASVLACEIERNITEYHLNSIENGFTGSYLINFCNGQPDDDTRNQIENDFSEKFTGSKNAGRVIFSFNDSAETKTTLEKMEITEFGEQYKALSDHSRQMIFTAFRCNPNLFGIPTESNGFNSEEYESAFKLYNRTQIKPVQKLIVDTYAKVLPNSNVTIVPFTLEGADNIVK